MPNLLVALSMIFSPPLPGGTLGGCPWLSTSQVCGPFHPGADYVLPYGTPVHAAAGGVVTFAGLGRWEWGRIVLLEHFTGDGPRWTQYAHLSRLDVMAGDEVYPGQVIGAVGDAGGIYAPHLHFEIRTCDRLADAWTQGMTRAQVEACYVEPDVKYYRASFYLDAELYADQDKAVKLARYVDDINTILAKNTNARLIEERDSLDINIILSWILNYYYYKPSLSL